MKEKKVEFNDKKTPQYSQLVNAIGEKLQDNSVGLTLNLKETATKFNQYAQMIASAKSLFDNRSERITSIKNKTNPKKLEEKLKDMD